MSKTEKFQGIIQLRKRLENETDKDYFERVTGGTWQVFPLYEPFSIQDAIYDNYMSNHEVKYGKKGYILLDGSIYEFLELHEKEIEESYCNMKKVGDNTYMFEAQYYNGGCSLVEILREKFDEKIELLKSEG